MKLKYFFAIIVIILFFLVIMGTFFGEECVSIAEFKGCWKIAPIIIKSELCPNASIPCEAKPEQQQYNAIVDLLLKACEKAKKDNYADNALNQRIEEVVKNFMGFDISANQLCDQPGMILTKRMYG